MRIVIEPGSYSLRNMGDAAMLQVAVQRLRRCLPLAELQVLTNDPSALAELCPDVLPLSAAGRAPWTGDRVLLGSVHDVLPGAASRMLTRVRLALGRRWPGPMVAVIAARLPEPARTRFLGFLDAVQGADMFVVVGQGAMNDATSGHAMTVLETLALAHHAAVPTAMMGQGIGPLVGKTLRARARAVLPDVRLIALREGLSGPRLLSSLGVADSSIAVTGDDAVELAYAQRRDTLGNGLGINMRVARNAGTDEAEFNVVRDALAALDSSLGHPPLVPAPIALGVARDVDVIRRIIPRAADVIDAGEELDSPSSVIGRIAGCRLLVTGAYHAAVFALAQGIPVVCLSGSRYYEDKFRGLLDLFPRGGEMVSLRQPHFAGRLVAAAHVLWRDADERRPALLGAAASQLAAGHAAYARVAGLLPSSKHAIPSGSGALRDDGATSAWSSAAAKLPQRPLPTVEGA